MAKLDEDKNREIHFSRENIEKGYFKIVEKLLNDFIEKESTLKDSVELANLYKLSRLCSKFS